MTLTQKIDAYTPNFWDFSEYRGESPLIHYPATMVAPMQIQLISDILEDDNSIESILDPFVGSGTIMEIGSELGIKNLFGIDINPLAALITEVRLFGFSNEALNASIQKLRVNLTYYLGNVPIVFFPGITKWFRVDIIHDLSLLKFCIQAEPDHKTRKLYWVCFAEIVRKYCNSRSSTFKLHTKTPESIQNIDNSCVEDFVVKINEYLADKGGKECSSSNITLICGNSTEVLKTLESESVDLICTSPPYGDNQTTVTYGQFSILQLRWIDKKDLPEFPSEYLKTTTAIDSVSLGGSLKLGDEKAIDSLFMDLIEGISQEKRKKIISFFRDYSIVFAEMCRVLKRGKRLVLTIGNRRVDNQEILFSVLNDRLAKVNGMELETEFSRSIYGKRMPLRVSSLPNIGSVKSMNLEFVKIYHKM